MGSSRKPSTVSYSMMGEVRRQHCILLELTNTEVSEAKITTTLLIVRRGALSKMRSIKNEFLLEKVTKDKTRGIVAKTGPPCPFVQSDSILPSKEKEKKFSQEILSAVNKKCFFFNFG